jgi:hypothetical protein
MSYNSTVEIVSQNPRVIEVSDGSIVVITDVGLNGATKQSVTDEATARANADTALTTSIGIVASDLDTHEALTTAHGSTSANTASRIVQRSAAGVTSLSGLQLDTTAAPADAIGLISWNDVDKTAQVVTEGGVILQLGQEETVYVRNNSGLALANGTAVFVTGATGQRPTVAKATANSSTAQKMIGLVTTAGGIADNAFGFVTIAGIVHDLDTSSFAEGAEIWLSPTVAGGFTATQPSGDTQRIMRVGYVIRPHATQGEILVATHYHGTPLANSLMESEGAAAARTNLGLGTLATQSGTFSGTSSGTNTGDQNASTVSNTPAGNIAATTVQAAINELDSEKQPLALVLTNTTASFTTAQETKLAGIAAGATANSSDATLLARANHTGTQSADTLTNGTSNKVFTAAEQTKLAAISGTNTGDQTITLTGDVTGSGTGSFAATIANNAVTNAKSAQVATQTFKGRNTAATGNVEDLSVATVKTMLAISNVDNTSDANKPVSTAQQTALDLKADRVSQWYADGYLNSDGATSNRAQIQGPFDAVNNPRGWVAGAATLTWRGVVVVPTVALSASAEIATLSPATNNPAQSFGLRVLLRDLGSIQIAQLGASSYSTLRQFESAFTFMATYSGQTITLEIIWTQGTANPVIRVNEVDISASFALTTAGTPPAWLDATMVPTYHLTGYNWPSGPAPIGCWILGSLTDADRAFWRTTGKPPAWVVAGGSARNAITNVSRNSDFSALATDWTGSANISVSAASGALVATTNGSAGNQGVQLALSNYDGARFRNGCKVLVTGTVLTNTIGGSITIAGGDGTNKLPLINSGTGSFSVEIPWASSSSFPSNNSIQLITGTEPASVQSWSIDNLVITPLGALSLPGIQPCAVVDDLTTIGGNQARLVGVTAVTPKRDWRIAADTWTNGNQRILEGALIDSTADIIDSIEQTTTGTPTTTIGSASAGSQYKASSALSAGINPTTLVTRKAASSEFWVGSNSTAVVRTTIKGHRAI